MLACVICLGTNSTGWKAMGSIPSEIIAFFNVPYSSHIMALGSIQHLAEMSSRNLPVGKGRPARKPDNPTVTRRALPFYKPRTQYEVEKTLLGDETAFLDVICVDFIAELKWYSTFVVKRVLRPIV
jgi:hypothetical protein